MPNPANRMLPNIMIVQPPSTACGIVVRAAPIAGNTPPIIITTAPTPIVKRLTTPDMAARPTFWLNDVIGVQPNRPDTELTKPSQQMADPISLVSGSRFKALLQSADVSPIVSVADTRYTATTDSMAPMLNSGVKGSKRGRAMMECPLRLSKLTIPIKQAST